MRSIATSTSVTRSMALFLSMRTALPALASIMSPARTTASTAVVRNSGLSGIRSGGHRTAGAHGLPALDHPHLHATLRGAMEIDFVHEVADEKNAAPAAFQEIFRRQRIGHGLGVKPLSLIADQNDH